MLRSGEMPYGLPHVTARECRQLHAGNVFLCLCFQIFLSLSLQGKFWALENPKEGASYTPSIWRLFVVRILNVSQVIAVFLFGKAFAEVVAPSQLASCWAP